MHTYVYKVTLVISTKKDAFENRDHCASMFAIYVCTYMFIKNNKSYVIYRSTVLSAFIPIQCLGLVIFDITNAKISPGSSTHIHANLLDHRAWFHNQLQLLCHGWPSCFACTIDRGFVAVDGRGLDARS